MSLANIQISSVLGLNEGTPKRRVFPCRILHIFRNIWHEALSYRKLVNVQRGKRKLKGDLILVGDL